MINPMKEFGWKNVAFYWIAFIVLKIAIFAILQIFKITRYNKPKRIVFFIHLAIEMIGILLLWYVMSYLIEKYGFTGRIISFMLFMLGFGLNIGFWIWLDATFVKNRSLAGVFSTVLMNMFFFALYSFFSLLVFDYQWGQHMGELNPVYQGKSNEYSLITTDFSIFRN